MGCQGPGCDVNDGYNERQPTLSGCAFHCKNNYPTAPYFTWITPASSWTDGRESCYCKVGVGTRKFEAGMTSGPVDCVGATTTMATSVGKFQCTYFSMTIISPRNILQTHRGSFQLQTNQYLLAYFHHKKVVQFQMGTPWARLGRGRPTK